MISFIVWYLGFLVVSIAVGFALGYPLIAFVPVILIGGAIFGFLSFCEGRKKK